MRLDLTTAVRLGWQPERIKRPVELPCQAGCGRSLTVDRGDRVSYYLCPSCRKAYVGFLAVLRRRRAKHRAISANAKQQGLRASERASAQGV